MNFDFVNRIEVIDENGRSYTNYKVDGATFALQDDGKTLKIFVTTGKEDYFEKTEK